MALWAGAAGLAGPLVAQDPAAERLLREAQRLEEQDPRAALDTYELLVGQFPDDAAAAEALLRSVRIHRRDRDAARTDFALDRLLAEYGRSPQAAEGFLIRGEIDLEVARSVAELEGARDTLRRVPLLFAAEAYPDLPARAEARLLAGRVSRFLGQDDDALAAFLTLIEDEPTSAATGRARRELAWLLIARGAWREAAEILQRAVDAARAARDADAPTDDTSALALPAGPAAAETRLLALIDRRIVRPIAGQPLFGAPRLLSVNGIEEPIGIAAHDDGRLLVIDDGSPAVAVAAPDGRVLARAAVKDAAAPWWDGTRPTVAAGVRLTQPFGGRATDLDQPGKGDGPLKGIVAVARGVLRDRFVVAKGEPGLLRYATRARGASLLAETKRQVTDVTADVHGQVYALDRTGARVWRIGIERRPDGSALVTGGWKRPVAVAVDPLGYVFVLDRASRQVTVFDDAGNRASVLGPTFDGFELRAPSDLAVDGSGRLTIADPKLATLVVLE